MLIGGEAERWDRSRFFCWGEYDRACCVGKNAIALLVLKKSAIASLRP
ncbi:hypothetical protein [Coleofasciculus sp. FACHB-SPT9]|nr:hypothetical protein [Coleofasciculus sp. FACHB-SPT9]MBD1892889.1 hypothetical protein [Coleofasciculus sp. FACHB-SPT9]